GRRPGLAAAPAAGLVRAAAPMPGAPEYRRSRWTRTLPAIALAADTPLAVVKDAAAETRRLSIEAARETAVREYQEESRRIADTEARAHGFQDAAAYCAWLREQRRRRDAWVAAHPNHKNPRRRR